MKWIGIIVGIVVGASLESTFFHVPFVLITLLLAVIFIQKPWIIFLSIPAGFLLDSLTFRVIGESSLFFAVMMGLSFTYGKKFEVKSIGFVAFASCISSVVYLVIFGSDALFPQTFFSVVFALCLFLIASFFKDHFSRKGPSYLSW